MPALTLSELNVIKGPITTKDIVQIAEVMLYNNSEKKQLNLNLGLAELKQQFVDCANSMRENKWRPNPDNEEEQFTWIWTWLWRRIFHGNGLTISEDGLKLIHNSRKGWNTALAVFPVPKFCSTTKKPYIVFYFEVTIIQKTFYSIDVGFCDQKFPVEGDYVGDCCNSIGIWRKNGIAIDGSWIELGNNKLFFIEGNVVGIGLIFDPANSSLLCFCTCNLELLGSTELPNKFLDIELFPAVSFFGSKEIIRANFGKDDWCFNPQQLI